MENCIGKKRPDKAIGWLGMQGSRGYAEIMLSTQDWDARRAVSNWLRD